MCFAIVFVTDIFDYMMYSNFLATNSEAAYVRYIRVDKMLIGHKLLLPSPTELGTDGLEEEALGTTLFEDPTPYNCSEGDILLII